MDKQPSQPDHPLIALALGVPLALGAGLIAVIPGFLAFRTFVHSPVDLFMFAQGLSAIVIPVLIATAITLPAAPITRKRRVGLALVCAVPGVLLWVVLGLLTDPIDYRVGGVILGVIAGSPVLFVPLAVPAKTSR